MNLVIMDDDKALLRSLEILLVSRGHVVRSFHNPLEACSALQGGLPPDVLLLDFMMPELNAPEFLGRIGRQLPPTCKVILISGHTDLIEPLNLGAMGISAFLPKPLDFDRLCELVDEKTG